MTLHKSPPGWGDRETAVGYRSKLLDAALSGEGDLRRKALHTLFRWDMWTCSTTLNWDRPDDDNIYRVGIYPDGVTVVCFGLARVDSRCEGRYNSVDDLPKWVQERLAVLMITSTETPTAEVEGVGRRISSNTFWVFAPEGVA